MEDRIRELAYLKWEAAGYPNGDGVDFWLQAEEELSADLPSTCEEAHKPQNRKVAAKASAKRK
jgi:hypothetical protein